MFLLHRDKKLLQCPNSLKANGQGTQLDGTIWCGEESVWRDLTPTSRNAGVGEHSLKQEQLRCLGGGSLRSNKQNSLGCRHLTSPLDAQLKVAPIWLLPGHGDARAVLPFCARAHPRVLHSWWGWVCWQLAHIWGLSGSYQLVGAANGCLPTLS